MLRVLLMFSTIFLTAGNCQVINELPHCVSEKSSLVYVSTLDGKLSALSAAGSLEWTIDTGPGPLLISNIHNLELTNNGEWIRIIPSLSGTLYKFDGITIDPIPISADSLLKSSFRYSDDLVIAGGVEVRTYGIGFRSGKLFYECTPTKCTNDEKRDASDDVLLIERTTQIIRAVEPRSGSERWNFSVGLNDIKLSRVSCVETTKLFDWNITAIIPDGVLRASKLVESTELSWKYKFSAPIVRVWHWNGHRLEEIDLFAPKMVPNILVDPVKTTITPAIYLGMHDKQLYVHESVVMQNILQGKANTDIAVTETHSLAKIPWNPVPASGDTDVMEDSTAISVLNGSEYVNGNGFYFYTDIENGGTATKELCEKNETIDEQLEISDEAGVQEYVDYVLKFQIEIMVVIVTTLICNFIYRLWSTNSKCNTPNEASSDGGTVELERRISETNEQPFQSRYINDFDIIRCLGKGGFGVVFEAKQRFDEGSYAIKRITLSNKENSRSRVMREVKVLARLDHQNIVRYFGSWEERPPADWCEEHDQKMLADLSQSAMYSSGETTAPSRSRRNKSTSVSINMDELKNRARFDDDDDSFIEFAHDEDESNDEEESDESDGTAKTRSTVELHVSEHEMKKINWRRPSYKHHSWDSFQSNLIDIKQKDPPVFLYIQMQLCKKESLKEWLQENVERNYDVCLAIFKQILSAVEYVHLRGLIHRDLKPSNILFSLDGQVKVADFGLVKAMQEPCGVDTQKGHYNYNHSVNVGTMLYMSPEQLNSRKYDYKVDIYSLGLIFFELLVPFRTDSERIKVLTNLKKHLYPEEFKEMYPKEFVLIDNMLNEVPEKRLTTIGIKARAPCNMKDGQYDESYHFKLPVGRMD